MFLLQSTKLTRPFSCSFPWYVGDRASSLAFLLDESVFFRGVGLLDLRFALGVGDLDLCFAKSVWWFGLTSNFLCGVGLLERFFCSSHDCCWCCCLLPAVGRWGVGDRERLLEMLLGGACSCAACRFCTEPTLDAELRRVLGGDDLMAETMTRCYGGIDVGRYRVVLTGEFLVSAMATKCHDVYNIAHKFVNLR